jgi:uncharacterized delta-60 repeat protein
MRQFAGLLTSAVLCSLLCATAQVVVVQPDPVEGLPPEGATPLSLDPSFSFAETNLTAILDIELFPDGRIAYAGVAKPAGTTMTMGAVSEAGALPRANYGRSTSAQPNFGGSMMAEARSIAVEPSELIFFGAGVPLEPARTSLFDGPVRKIIGPFDYWPWTFNAGLIGIANEVHVLSNRQVLVAGRFRTLQSPETTNGLQRLEINGTLDTNWTAVGSANLEVTTFEILADGRILGAYQATNENGLLEFGFGRWDSNGARDLSYSDFLALDPNTQVTALRKAPGTNGFVMAIQAQDAENRPVTRLVLLNEVGERTAGPQAETLNQLSVEGTVSAIAFESTNSATLDSGRYDRILIGGDFTRVGANDCKNLAALAADGTVAWSFVADNGPDGAVETVEVQPDGKILIGGRFTNVNGVAVNGIARLLGRSVEGSQYLYWGDSEFRGFERLGATELILRRHGGTNETLTVNLAVTDVNDPLTDIVVPPQVVFGVGETRAIIRVTIRNDALRKQRRRFGLRAVAADQTVLTTRPQTHLVVLDDETAGTLIAESLRWDSGGTQAHAVQSDGKMLASSVDGKIIATHGPQIMRFNTDGTVDTGFITNGIPFVANAGEIRQILPQPGGKIYVAGRFYTTTSNPDINHVARLNSDGTLDRTFNPRLRPGSTSNTRGMAAVEVLDDGKVLIWTSGGGVSLEFGIGGLFLYSATGQLIRQYSGITPWQDAAVMAHLPTGEVFAYGHFPSYTQLPKYMTNGVMDTNFVARISGRIMTMSAVEGWLYVAGYIESVNDAPVSYIARLDPETGELDTDWKLHVNGAVTALEITETNIYISGHFTKVNGVERMRLARLMRDGSLDESFDPGLGPVEPGSFLHEEDSGALLAAFWWGGFDRIAALPIVRLESGLGTSKPQPATLEIANDEAGVVVRYSAGALEESADLEAWAEVHTGGGEHRPSSNETMRFYRVVTP